MIKLDLTNGFFHIPLSHRGQSLIGIKCGSQYYSIQRLHQGLSISPFVMQQTMLAIFRSLLAPFRDRFLLYLVDIIP